MSLYTKSAVRLATYGTLALTLASALILSQITVRDWKQSSILIAFHIILLLNTYYSIRCFSSIPESNSRPQAAVNTMLVLLYLLLAAELGDPLKYMLVLIAMFLVASLKYAMLLSAKNYRTLLKRKIRLDLLCGAACVLTLAGVLSGDVMPSLYIWLGIFIAGNVDILIFRKLYIPAPDSKSS